MKSLKWWMSDSIDCFMCAREGGVILRSSVLIGPVGMSLTHCAISRIDSRISWMRHM